MLFSLYYLNSKKQGELDFVVEKDGMILPIEVKSGKDYAVHRALTNILENSEYNIKEALVLSNSNVKQVGKILYVPIYMVMFLEKRRIFRLYIELICQLFLSYCIKLSAKF